MRWAEPQCDFISDCSGVIDAWKNGLKWAIGPKRPHAGIWKDNVQFITDGKGPKSIEKVKAHQALDGLVGVDWMHAKGNKEVDLFAKRAARMHGLGAGRQKELANRQEGERDACIELGKRLAAWPHAKELHGDLDKADQEVRDGKRKVAHEMAWEAGVWKCLRCWTKPRMAGQVPTSYCPRRPVSWLSVLENPRGHRIVAAQTVDESAWIFWCVKCGYYMQTRPRKLLEACPGRPSGSAGKRALRIFGDARHPVTNVPLQDFHYFDGELGRNIMSATWM
jgi:hypothetical protein